MPNLETEIEHVTVEDGSEASQRLMTTALYCRSTGRRLAPDEASAPREGSPSAILSFEDGTTIPLFGDTIIGRAPELDRRVRNGAANALTLPSPERKLSRSHVYLRVTRWEVEVIDLGSKNGTWIAHDGGEWTALIPGLGAFIEDGQVIKVGESLLRVHRLAR